MPDTEILEGLAELGTAIVDADVTFINKRKAQVTRLVTYISSKFSAGAGLTKTGESYAITAGGVGTTQLADSSVTSAKIADGTIATGDMADDAVTNAKLRDSAGVSVIGRSAGTTGDPADITASADDRLLGRSGGVLGFIQLTIGMIADGLITRAKLANATALSVIGRSANSTGVPADIAASSDGEVLRRSGATLGFGTVVAAGIAASAVTMAKLAAWPAASIHRATAQSIGSGSLTIVQLNSSTFSATGGGDAPQVNTVTNYRITIVRAGLYRVSARVSITPSATLGVFAGSICLNGGEAAQAGVSAVSGTPTTLCITELMSLAVNDYLDLRIYHTVGSSQNTGTGTHLRPILQAEYVGPTA